MTGPLAAPRLGWHHCPRPDCGRTVPDRYFACRGCWFALPAEIRRTITATARLPLVHSRRRWAVRQARHAWEVMA